MIPSKTDIVFDFVIPEKEKILSWNTNDSIASEDSGVLRLTYFEVELSMKYKEGNVFERKYVDGTIFTHARISLLGFVLDSLDALRQLSRHARTLLMSDGSAQIFYEYTSIDTITVGILGGTKSVAIPHEELYNALIEFKERVRTFLVERAPAIQKNPAWKEWFPES